MTREAMLYQPLSDGTVRCDLCNHHCRIEPDDTGFCGVRQNKSGTLYSRVYGKTIARNTDPVEKKPLYHFLPGSRAFSIGTVGCNFHCGFCQNWQISQFSPTGGDAFPGMNLPPDAVVAQAREGDCASIAYTYTEPTIFFEYAHDTAEMAHAEGIRNLFVTNGFMTEAALDRIAPYLDAANVDLKSWSNDYYREVCKGRLAPVTRSIRHLVDLGIWVEVTTLLIPGDNDGVAEMEGIAGFLAEVDPNIPWHISAFHPAHEYGDRSATPIETLDTARDIGRKAGLRYIYLGNVGAPSDTVCPDCGETLVERRGMGGGRAYLADGACPGCGAVIPGRWG